MDTTSTDNQGCDDFTVEELRAIREQLASLACEATEYPVECAVGSIDFLFESRDDIETLVESLMQDRA